jgi:hypothetical protein
VETGWEGQSTEAILERREHLVNAVWEAGVKIVTEGSGPYPLAEAIVPMQVMFVEQLDAELFRRGVNVPAPPWD